MHFERPTLSRTRSLIFVVSLMLLGSMLVACGETDKTESNSDNYSDSSRDYAGKKVLFVNSYHAGYEWSDGIETGIHSVLDDTGVEIKIVYMDTKRNTDEGFRVEAGEQAKTEIDSYEPDVILVADDNAQQFLVVPHLMEASIPIVFLGVNWDASAYGYPTENITGMIEVELVAELMDRLGEYADTARVGYVTITSETERKVIEEYNTRFFDGQMQAYEASSLDEFKEEFLQAQDEMDVVLIGNNAGVEWDIEDASQFFAEQTRVPTGSINSWMAQYAMVTLAKSPEEQGEWAAQTALNILDGQSPSDIPVTENVRGELILNLDIAEQLEVVFQPSLLRVAEVVNGSGQGAQ
jgi:ABC-type uncharacterized transport system substrate-binding protein